MLTVAITAPTPMTIPSMVSDDRSLFRASVRNARRTVLMKSIFLLFQALVFRLLSSAF